MVPLSDDPDDIPFAYDCMLKLLVEDGLAKLAEQYCRPDKSSEKPMTIIMLVAPALESNTNGERVPYVIVGA